MGNFYFWQRWLLVVGIIVSLFGLFISFFSGTALFALFDSLINPVFWGAGPLPDDAKAFQKWIYGAWGATVAGWGIFIIFLARNPFKKKEKWSWHCLWSGLLLWFIVDTGFSAYFRVYMNVILNTFLFLAVLIPVFFTRKQFVRSPRNCEAPTTEN
ncbi:MAG: hypothetical protein A2Y79_00635 [Deltaproteobacteria bacterium RBG_13_43_22]|nr:MAG: hypothetical protein A2Y79_00635 [Deltaproteobacteria bacterium RBG_13_43_22]